MAARIKRKKAVKRISDVSAEEFLRDGFDSEDEDVEIPLRKVSKLAKNYQKLDLPAEDELKKHKHDLKKLEETDPEFYKYLQENDKALLDFDISDLSDDESEGEPDLHKAEDAKLEVASDESEAEDEADETENLSGGRVLVSKAMINRWTDTLKEDTIEMKTLVDVVDAFVAAVEQAEGHSSKSRSKYKVAGSIIFNGVMRLCVVYLPNAIKKLLKISDKKDDKVMSVSKCKRWSKIQTVVKKYLTHLLKVLAVVSESEIVSVLLKHVYQMSFVVTATNRLARAFLKRLIVLWSTGEESVRVLAFMSTVSITRALEDVFHEFVLKSMYMSYVKNVKFTSPTTWPVINFMKHCLVEIFALNERLAYQYGFVYIRQLAIHLRNAIAVKKKDSIQAVYNWQFIHCLGFWAQLISSLHHISILQSLVYPLVQTIIGTVRLVPTAKYYPLRFHCVRYLTNLTKCTGCFIPVLPILMQVLETTDFNGKGHKQSWKPLDFVCMLKLSKSQLAESGFKDTLIDHLYELLMDYLSVVSHKIGFPELVLPCVLQMKTFLKRCHVANYCKQVKTLLDKIEESSRHICEQRKSLTVKLSDRKSIDAWESQQKVKETPLSKYYTSYRRLRDREVLHGITKKDQMEDLKMPTVNRRELMEKHKKKDKEDLGQLFIDDDSDTEIFSKKIKSDDECSDLTSLSSSEDEGGDDNNEEAE